MPRPTYLLAMLTTRPQVRLCQIPSSVFIALLYPLCQLHFFLGCEQSDSDLSLSGTSALDHPGQLPQEQIDLLRPPSSSSSSSAESSASTIISLSSPLSSLSATMSTPNSPQHLVHLLNLIRGEVYILQRIHYLTFSEKASLLTLSDEVLQFGRVQFLFHIFPHLPNRLTRSQPACQSL